MTLAITNCAYENREHDDSKETNHKYSILCVGNTFSAAIFGFTGMTTVIGGIYGLMKIDVEMYLAFTIFGILAGYTSDAITNLRVNCDAGRTSSYPWNSFGDDTFDSASHLCNTLAYSTAGGLIGMIGGLMAGGYGVLMKLRSTFYVQRPVGLFIAIAGYAAIWCFTAYGNSIIGSSLCNIITWYILHTNTN